jgi:hypothetical protein
MAANVLFVTPSNAPAGYFLSLSDQTNTLELVAVKSEAKMLADEETARDLRDTVMRARTSDGRHVALAVEIQNAEPL